MNELESEVREHYTSQELDSAVLERLLAMEAEADAALTGASTAPEPPPPPANDTRGFRPWMGLGVAAVALLAVGITVPVTLATFATRGAPDAPIPVASTSSPDDGVVDLGLDGERTPRQPVGQVTTTSPGGDFADDVNRIDYDLDRLVEPTGGTFAGENGETQIMIIAGSKARTEELRNPWGDPSSGLDAIGYTDGTETNDLEWTNRGPRTSTADLGDDDGGTPVREYRERLTSQPDGTLIVLEDSKRSEDADGRFQNGIVAGPTRPGWVDLTWKPSHTLTTIDALSTFAVDVDTGAWTRSRRALSEGYLPNPAEVRPEELINAFRYDYEGPTSGPFAASVEVVPSPFDADRHLVRIGVQGKRISVFERKPVHATFLIDVSGSMQSRDRLPLVKQGLKMLVGELKDGDTVAIVTYSGNTRIALEPTSVTNTDTILRALDRLETSGGTAMGAGIDLAYGLAERTLEPGAINRVILASDGDANVGETDADRLAAKLRAAADRGITLTTLGVGSGNYRDDVMERLADKGDGHYHYLANEKDARKVLVDGLTGTLQTIARDVKLQVELDPEIVSEWRQIGYENRQIADRDFRNDRVDAGEVGAGHQVTALYEVKLRDPSVSSVLGDLRVRYEAPGAEGAPAVERTMKLVGTPRKTLREASDGTRVAVVAAAFAERLRGHTGPALTSLDDLLPVRPEYAEDDEELRQAIRQAQRLGLQ
ncbi:MAG: von Willebrand factor type A domain-containing protein [Myxococcota bacterium]